MAARLALSESDSVEKISGIGPSYSAILSRLDIKTVGDMIHHLPRRYLDFTRVTPIAKLTEKRPQVIKATIDQPRRFTTRGGKLIITATAADQSGKIKLYWFNNGYITRLIRPGETYFIAGTPSLFANKMTLIAPQIEITTGSQITKHLLPVYPLTAKLTNRWLRHKIKILLESTNLPEPIPKLVKTHHLLDYQKALTQIHFPKNKSDKDAADQRLAFNRHLATNLINLTKNGQSSQSKPLTIDYDLHQNILDSLPFTLTPDQHHTIASAYSDLTKNYLSQRLIQGETGSGKTVVLFFLAHQALQNQASFCLLAPTQILAEQHYQTFCQFGLPKNQLLLITSQQKMPKLPSHPLVFIGTHALLTKLPKNLKPALAVVAIDEQHKFGVKQREKLTLHKPAPHIFNLSATPIPRTLALGFFGEIEISTIKNKPLNRQTVKTLIVDPEHYQSKSTPWLTQKLKSNAKIFVVCPLIHAGDDHTSSAEGYFINYQKKFGKIAPVFLIHGQMKAEKMVATLNEFKKSSRAILVSTTVIEVGVDIPEAEVMIIHGAERFGLATLHQLRGRIGRGEKSGYCFLIPDSAEKTEITRLKLLEKYDSGLTLSRLDVRLRGSGEIFGFKQHGWLPVRLKHFWDVKLYQETKKIAAEIVTKDPQLATSIAQKLISW